MKELILKYGLKRNNGNIQVTKNTEKAREELSTLQRNKQNIIDYLQKLEAETVEKVLNGEYEVEISERGVATIANYPEELDIFSSVIAERVTRILEIL